LYYSIAKKNSITILIRLNPITIEDVILVIAALTITPASSMNFFVVVRCLIFYGVLLGLLVDFTLLLGLHLLQEFILLYIIQIGIK
jgi:hypothetical protein